MMVNELFAFLISVANPVGGVVAPIELRVILAVFAHVLGVITQAGIILNLASSKFCFDGPY